MTTTKKKTTGRPTREEKRAQELTEAFKLMAETQARHQELLETLLKQKDEPREKEYSRTLESPIEAPAMVIPQPAPGEPATVYKCKSRGLRLVLVPGREITRSNGSYRVIPPVCADFENGTYRTNNPEAISIIDNIIDERKARGKQPIVVRVKGEAAARLQTPETDKRARDLTGEGASIDEVAILS